MMTIARSRGFGHFGLIALSILLIHACREPPPPPERVIRPVRVMRAVVTGGIRARSFSGVARAGVESTLSFRVAGSIQALPVRVGNRVAAGQLIASLDAVDYELQVNEAEAGLSQAEARSTNAEAGLSRVRGLYENDNASRADLDGSMAAAASAAAQVESAGKRLELASRRVDYTRLLAPASGAIAEVMAEVNENVNPGEPVAVLNSGDRAPEVVVAVPERLIRRIEDGAIVEVLFDAIPGTRFEGAVTEVGVSATGTATTFPVTVALRSTAQADADEMRPGMAAVVTFALPDDGRGERFVVPSQAVAEDRQGRFVFVAEPTPGDPTRAVVTRRVVTVGEFVEEGLEVLDGLREGDQVVTAGVSRLSDGDDVRLQGMRSTGGA